MIPIVPASGILVDILSWLSLRIPPVPLHPPIHNPLSSVSVSLQSVETQPSPFHSVGPLSLCGPPLTLWAPSLTLWAPSHSVGPLSLCGPPLTLWAPSLSHCGPPLTLWAPSHSVGPLSLCGPHPPRYSRALPPPTVAHGAYGALELPHRQRKHSCDTLHAP